MSFLKKLFGGGGGGSAAAEPTEYEGFRITPEPMSEGGKFRIAARIEKEVGGETKHHHLIRADTLNSRDEAEAASLDKAKVLIDQMGDRLFD